jgi:hypothetical protein
MRLFKGIISLLLIAGIFGIVGLYSQIVDLGVVSTFFRKLLVQYDWLIYFYQIVLLVLVVMIALIFLMIVFKPISKKEVHLAKETGQINLPLHTLESIARSSLKGIVNIDDTQVKVTLTKAQKANVEVAIADNNQQLFLSKGRRVRQQIEQALQQMAKLEVDHTKVIFKKKKADSPLETISKKESRVI